MASFFVPYRGGKPAALTIKGHQLLILARDRRSLQNGLELVGGDHIERIAGGSSREQQEVVVEKLARKSNAGVVIAPPETEMGELIRSLEHQLPWLQ